MRLVDRRLLVTLSRLECGRTNYLNYGVVRSAGGCISDAYDAWNYKDSLEGSTEWPLTLEA